MDSITTIIAILLGVKYIVILYFDLETVKMCNR